MDEEITFEETLTIVDLLKPWPHHLHVFDEWEIIFAACDCGWIGSNSATKRAAVQEYQAHIERPE